ncbi:DNA-3-methyladenine glycosylase I [Halomonas sp. BM-2019]|uniref:DNA-3-methyladenine glycosylase I n=1 Tax=Halomonas sp. BM-2019 TaxID=2811227 RepID=UPI001B3C2619|nr:MAG: DNA-3-methyladenine glycosylase I [Halomonas sp. BM-2019]
MGTGKDSINRCPWCVGHADYEEYHDQVWGKPVHDSVELFAKLCLDGQQAGLSWITILRKQAGYESAFFGFDPYRLAQVQGDARAAFIETQMQNRGIVRNRLKINAIFKNADAFVRLHEQGVDFAQWLWSFVGHSPVENQPKSMQDIATETAESQALSKALKKAGFTFVGPTIVYAFMQAVGMVNDHLIDCDFK